ncbi:MAG: aldehyde:ferredoxin oxidoreductase [Anaerolineales bacterium]|nr:aldehyde:ferredoxin oxidoreductase [Anaerolineales bacterium]
MATIAKPLETLKKAHQNLASYQYEIKPVDKGYANRTLHINLEDYSIREQPVTQQMKDLFTGGRGFALWLLWKAINDNTQWNDPENALVIANGPIGGLTAYPGLGKSTVVTLSPLTKSVIDSNVGGYFGPYLKFSGFDAIDIQGKAPEDVFGEVIIVIDGDSGAVSIETAPLEDVDSHLLANQLAEHYGDGKRGKYGVSTVTAGMAAEHINYACLNFSWYDVRRQEMRLKQAGRGGTGRVFRDKGIKGIVVKFNGLKGDVNNPVDMFMIRQAGKRINREISDLDDKQNQMRKVGTAHLVEIMDHFDLLPVHNFRYGAHPEHSKIDSSVWHEQFTQGINDACWAGCTMSCSHGVDGFALQTGPYKGQKVLVDGPEYENVSGLGSNIGVFDPLAVIEMNFYCDTYGVDTISFANCVAFVMECWQYGILDAEKTGGLDLTWGNADSALEILHQMARGEGFGITVGQGTRYMKHYFAKEFGGDAAFLNDIAMETKGLEISEYMTKESIAQQGGYGLALKGGQHDEAWLIFMDQVNKQLPTLEDKAEALHYFPMWRTWFSVHGLCKLPWNDILPENNAKTDEPHKVPEHVENYTWLYEGLTGKKVTPDDLLAQSERVYNFQRVFNLRVGFGTREHDVVPYRAMGPVTTDEYESRQERYDGQLKEILGLDPESMSLEEKMATLREYRYAQYAKMTDTVYKRRGWNNNGIPTVEKLKALGIDLPEVVEVVQRA